MGALTWGLPRQIVIDLARLHGSTVFVETGTHQGRTTRWASGHFEIVHTIERSEHLYNLYGSELSVLPGVMPHLGDSRDVLPKIVNEIRGRKAVYWLDGHWSGGETAGEHDECPLLDELACLSDCGEAIIAIDDARLFLCAPPLPHDPAQWPTIPEIMEALPAFPKGSFVQIVDDVILIIPDSDALRSCLIAYAQQRSGAFWRDYRRLQRMRFLFPSNLKALLSSVMR